MISEKSVFPLTVCFCGTHLFHILKPKKICILTFFQVRRLNIEIISLSSPKSAYVQVRATPIFPAKWIHKSISTNCKNYFTE